MGWQMAKSKPAFEVKARTGKACAYVYTRNDSESDHPSALSAHERTAGDYYDKHMAVIGYQWGGCFRDDFASGRLGILSRPGCRALFSYMRKGDAVILAKLETGALDLADLERFIDALAKEGARLYIIDPQMFFPSEGGRSKLRTLYRSLEYQKAMNGVLYRYFDAKMEKKGLVPRRSKCPWGMKKVKAGRVKITQSYYYKLAPKERWVNVGKLIQERVDKGESYSLIADALNTLCIKQLTCSINLWNAAAVAVAQKGYLEYLNALVTHRKYLAVDGKVRRVRVRSLSQSVDQSGPASSPRK